MPEQQQQQQQQEDATRYRPLPGKKAVPLAAASHRAALGRSFPCSFLGVQSRMASHAAATPRHRAPRGLSPASPRVGRAPAVRPRERFVSAGPLPPRSSARVGRAPPAPPRRASSSKAGSNGTQPTSPIASPWTTSAPPLIRQEVRIIFGLIERAQYSINAAVYPPGGVDVPCFHPDGTPRVHARVHAPRERADGREDSATHLSRRTRVLPRLAAPAPGHPVESYPNPLAPAAEGININARIMDMYVNDLLPALCQEGDDFNYGSTGLQTSATSSASDEENPLRKVRAQSKFQAKPEEFTDLSRRGRRGVDGSADVQGGGGQGRAEGDKQGGHLRPGQRAPSCRAIWASESRTASTRLRRSGWVSCVQGVDHADDEGCPGGVSPQAPRVL